DVERAELLHGRGRQEVGGQVVMVDQCPVAAEGGVGHDLHDFPEAAQVVLGVARRLVQCGGLHDGGQREFQVFAGKFGQGVLVGDDLALFGELDGAFQDAVGLGHDGVIGGSATAAHGAAAAV